MSAVDDIRASARDLALRVSALALDEAIEALNAAREELHGVSPMRNEPVDLVRWVRAADVVANDYNPNTVAAPEMRLLETSIDHDGFTQPIVTHRQGDMRVVVDGFHRSKVGKTSRTVAKRVRGYLPVVQIRSAKSDDTDRMASTIRHNRARGKHAVEPMSGIVAYLAKKGWNDARIGREVGMDQDEVLRLKQITGLSELFADREFSEAWEVS